MDKILWNKIENFSFDDSVSEYGFSIRLAYENAWSINYTQKAILEYKKFMYLAATSDLMVAPSQIVDIVWHQHLIFTQSYEEFCTILGKKIEHIPSTHNRSEKEKFSQAQDRTTRLYENLFGKQSDVFWKFESFIDSFQLGKSRFSRTEIIVICLAVFIVLCFPLFYLLKPVFMEINNPWFLMGYGALSIVMFGFLQLYNRFYISHLLKKVPTDSMLYDFNPFELIYMKAGSLSAIVHAYINQLLKDGILYIKEDRIGVKNDNNISNATCKMITSSIEVGYEEHYYGVCRKLIKKPVFLQMAKCIIEIDTAFSRSKQFIYLFAFDLAVIISVFMIGFLRLLTGIYRNLPVDYLIVFLIVFIIGSVIFLQFTSNRLLSKAISRFFKDVIIPSTENNNYQNWEWKYFLIGNAILVPEFDRVVSFVENKQRFPSDSASSGDSGGSSCGSDGGGSCSSCGGCGGD